MYSRKYNSTVDRRHFKSVSHKHQKWELECKTQKHVRDCVLYPYVYLDIISMGALSIFGYHFNGRQEPCHVTGNKETMSG